jgi:hypothetical protein
MTGAGRWGSSRALGIVALAVGIAACGRVKTSDGAAGNEETMPPVGAGGDLPIDPNQVPCTDSAFAPARISLLSDEQFANAVRDVFGVTLAPIAARTHQDLGYYGIDEQAQVGASTLDAYRTAADRVAIELKPCGSAPLDAACMEQYLRRTLPRAWRRSVQEQEIADLLQVFNAGLAINADVALQATMETVLTSGSFLYRSEIGESAHGAGSTSVSLTPYELASAVSFAVTNSVPDETLAAKASNQSLTEPATLLGEVDRLMATPAGKANLQKKVSYYLSLERLPFVQKDTLGFPQYTVSLRDGLYLGAQKFLEEVIWSRHFADLFKSHRVYANQLVAEVYGLPAVTGDGLVALDVAGDERGAGILTQPAFLAATNIHAGTDDIVHRGFAIYDSFVCGDPIANPPPNESAVFITLMGTPREKALQRDKLSCGACHRAFDPLGLVSENYDAIGRYRTQWSEDESGGSPNKTIVASAEIDLVGPDLDGPVSGINELAAKLSSNRRASDCAVVHLAQMLVDHRSLNDSCELREIKDDFSAHQSLPELIKTIVTSSAFLRRDWDPK